MGWAKLDDGYASHPKLIAAGLEATGLDARALAHCARYETDGFISDPDVAMLAAGANGKRLAKRLVDVGKWRRDDPAKGYWMHDYLAYNPSHEELDGRRQADRIRKGSERKPPRTPTGFPTESEQPPSGGRADSERTPGGPPVSAPAGQPPAPVPSRPVSHKSSSSDQGVGVAVAEEEDSSLRSEPRPTTDTATAADALAVAVMVAETRMRRRSEPPTSPGRWSAAVADDVLTEHGDRIRSLLAEGHDPASVATKIDPPATNGTPVVERRECCSTSVTVAHRIGCAVADEPTWDLDESGVAVRR